MVERILKIMEHEGFTPSKFAEEIGIQRSAISHILNRRNNVSLDVLLKIIDRFSYINTDWLLQGKGEMLRKYAADTPEMPENNTVISTDLPYDAEYRRDLKVDTPLNHIELSDLKHFAQPEKPIRNISKIMIFYTDNTFESYILEKDKKD